MNSKQRRNERRSYAFRRMTPWAVFNPTAISKSFVEAQTAYDKAIHEKTIRIVATPAGIELRWPK